MISRSWDIKLTVGMGWNGTGMGTHCDYIENLSPSFLLDLAWLWLGLRLRFVNKNCYYTLFAEYCDHIKSIENLNSSLPLCLSPYEVKVNGMVMRHVGLSQIYIPCWA